MKHIYDEVDSVVKTMEDTVHTTDQLIEPMRRSAFRRFPTLFTLLVGFGAGAAFFGIERLIEETMWLNERPWLIILFGVATLTLTGRLYKVLD